MEMQTYAVLAVAVIAIVVFWGLMKKAATKSFAFVGNSLLGIAILIAVNKFLGWSVPITFVTVGVAAIFGLPGIGALLFLYYFKMLG